MSFSVLIKEKLEIESRILDLKKIHRSEERIDSKLNREKNFTLREEREEIIEMIEFFKEKIHSFE